MKPLHRPSRAPIYLSAFVYPGAGQFMQRRRRAGLLFALAFSAAFLALVVTAGLVIVSYYSFALDFHEARASGPSAPVPVLVILFAVTLAIYIGNLIDVWSAMRTPKAHRPRR